MIGGIPRTRARLHFSHIYGVRAPRDDADIVDSAESIYTAVLGQLIKKSGMVYEFYHTIFLSVYSKLVGFDQVRQWLLSTGNSHLSAFCDQRSHLCVYGGECVTTCKTRMAKLMVRTSEVRFDINLMIYQMNAPIVRTRLLPLCHFVMLCSNK